jgi:hypothetical protein
VSSSFLKAGICFSQILSAIEKQNDTQMKLSQFRFDLPLNLIAQNPTKRREDSRMMVVHRKTGQIENKHF